MCWDPVSLNIKMFLSHLFSKEESEMIKAKISDKKNLESSRI